MESSMLKVEQIILEGSVKTKKGHLFRGAEMTAQAFADVDYTVMLSIAPERRVLMQTFAGVAGYVTVLVPGQ